ncbi:toprim domain-containing protein [Variovorax sp. PBL-E5]|uniref:toprim domain-containing protein n=1 Tax=Variovorax sp. PBL-E5 TaxID=434014 RepID=UPI001318CA81|nr:toprim domain-containing protein [Variovorax sp. PBL-E5]VTU37087.1 hypothetical protein E5CHR_04481 [Variovorax sp. PBL-E5]
MNFIDFARAHGIEIRDLHPMDKIQRCGTTEKPRSKNGAYFWDGRRGWVFAWDGEGVAHWYDDPNAAPWTEEDKKAWRAQKDSQKAKAADAQRKAAQRAAQMLRTAVPGTHDYLFRKRLPDAQGLVLPDGGLLVPMRDFSTNELLGAQVIRWTDTEEQPGVMRWQKKMTYGMRATGAVLRLGPSSAAETVLCEGYATGLSIDAALRQMRLNASTLVCFSDFNMTHVAGMLKSGRRYVFADNDKSGAGQRAAKQTGLHYCMSPVLGEDANDLHARAGLLAVCELLMQVRKGESVT